LPFQDSLVEGTTFNKLEKEKESFQEIVRILKLVKDKIAKVL
jgi:hypothetical protein